MKTFFFDRHKGKLETFAKICVAASLETLSEELTVRVHDKQASWKLLSKISRTAPGTGHILNIASKHITCLLFLHAYCRSK